MPPRPRRAAAPKASPPTARKRANKGKPPVSSPPPAPARPPPPRTPRPTLRGPVTMPRRMTPKFRALGDVPGVPAGYMAQVQRHFRFSGDMYSGVDLHLCEPLCLIGPPNENNTAYPGLIFSSSTDGSTVADTSISTVALNPLRCLMKSFYTSSHWNNGIAFADAAFLANIVQSFTDFQVQSTLSLHYRPLVPTSDTNNFILAVSNDGAHPIVGVPQAAAPSYPTFTNLDNGITSIAFPSWEPWSCEWPVDHSMKKVYQLPVYTSDTATATYPEPDTRMCSFGSLACVSSYNTGTDAAGISGQLYWEFKLRLSGPFPISARNPVFTRLLGLAHDRILARTLTPVVRLGPKQPIEVKGGVARVSTDDDDFVVTTPSSLPPGYLPVPGIPGMFSAPLVRGPLTTSAKKT
jgi:hypothetical protein